MKKKKNYSCKTENLSIIAQLVTNAKNSCQLIITVTIEKNT